jgi:hypothetical protein
VLLNRNENRKQPAEATERPHMAGCVARGHNNLANQNKTNGHRLRPVHGR